MGAGELLKEDDKGKLRKIAHCLEDWINKKKCSDTSSDIVFCVMSVVFPFRGCCSFLFGLFRYCDRKLVSQFVRLVTAFLKTE